MLMSDTLKLNIPEQFGADEDTFDTDAIREVYEQLDPSVTTAYGVSQFVIISKEWDKVIKIPFNGEFFLNDEDDIDFNYYGVNYCERTCNLYEDAIKAGVDCFFAGIEFYGFSANGCPIYAQEKVDYCLSDRNTDEIRNSIKRTDSFNKIKNIQIEEGYNSKWGQLDTFWLAAATNYWGIEKVNDLLDFIKINVDDLHSGNYGYKANGTPMIFDYSGFDF